MAVPVLDVGAVMRDAGFVAVELGELVDVFSGSAHESDAGEFETRGVTFRARKPRRGEG